VVHLSSVNIRLIFTLFGPRVPAGKTQQAVCLALCAFHIREADTDGVPLFLRPPRGRIVEMGIFKVPQNKDFIRALP
jgi:hypothetical protein